MIELDIIQDRDSRTAVDEASLSIFGLKLDTVYATKLVGSGLFSFFFLSSAHHFSLIFHSVVYLFQSLIFSHSV